MRFLPFRRFVLALIVVAPVVVFFSIRSKVASSETPALVPVISATKTAALVAGNGDADADPGDTIEYTVTVNNIAAPGAGNDATGVSLADTLQGITTLVAGSANILPNARNDTFNTIGNVQMVVPDGATDLLGNDVDFDGGTVTITGFGDTLPNANVNAAGTTATIGGASVTVLANGAVTVNPGVGSTSTITFFYTVSDGSPGGTDTAQVTVTVAGLIWFVNNTAGACPAAPCDGRLTNPFTSTTGINGLATNQTAFIFGTATPYSAAVILKTGQTVIGQGASGALVGPGSITGFTAPSGTNQLPSTGGAFPTLTTSGADVITLASNDRIFGVTVNPDGAGGGLFGNNVASVTLTDSNISDTGAQATQAGIELTGTTNGLTFGGTVSISTTGSRALDITGAALAGAIQNTTVAGGTNGAVSLTTTTGGLTFRNLSVTTTSGAAAAFIMNNAANIDVDGAAFVTNISATGGPAVDATGLAAGSDLNFDTATSASSSTDGINLDGTGAWTFSAGAGSITGAAGIAFDLNGGSGDVTYPGNLNNGAGATADITGRTGGTVTLSGSIIDTNDAGGGITMSGNTGGSTTFTSATKVLDTGASAAFSSTGTAHTISFTNGGLLIRTTSGAGFSATGGGTVTVQGTGNTIKTQGGTALNVSNTNIGLNGLTFECISAGRNDTGGTACNLGGATGTPANGIVLSSTGTTAGVHGGLTITGTGTTDGSGGTIQNTTGRGASFITARNISLSNMTFTNAGTTDLDATNGGLSTGDNLDTNAAIHLATITNATLTNVDITGGAEQGINGNNVSGFSLLNSTVTNVGNAADEDNIHFFNMSGTSAITGTTLTHTSGGGDDNMNLQTQAGTLNLTISGSSAVGVAGGVNQLGSGFLFGIRGTTNATITFNNSAGPISSTNNFSGGLVADVFDSATMALTVSNFTSSGNNDQLSVSAGDNSNVDLTVNNSTLSSVATGDFVVVSLLGSAFDNGFTFDSRIQNNNITVANGLAADGIIAFNAGGGAMNMLMSGNTIDYAGTQRAIAFQAGQDGNGANNLTITGNTIDVKLDGAGNAVTGILAQTAITGPGNTSSLCADIGGAGALSNTFTHSLGGAMAGGDIRVRQRNDGTIRLPGYAGGATDTAAVIAYLNGRNVEVSPSTATADSTGYAGGAACTQPTFASLTNEGIPSNKAEVNVAEAMLPNTSVPASQGFDAAQLIVDHKESAGVAVSNNLRDFNSEDLAAVVSRIVDPVSNGAASGYAALGTLTEMISPTVYAQEPESGETVNNGPFTLPAGESAVLKFRATVDAGPYASGVDCITNTAAITGTNFTQVNASIPSTIAAGCLQLDAEPDLIVTKTDGPTATTTEPGEMIAYTITYSNSGVANANGAPQHTANVVLTETVPTNTTFNAGASTAGWGGPGCVDGALAGTVCTLNVGAVNAGAAAGNAIFTVNVPALLPVSAVNVPNTSTIAESPANFNGTDRNTADNTTTDTDNIIGNWDGSTSTDWNVAANWSNNVIPPAGNNISVPDVANAPAVISQDVTVGMLTLGDNLSIGVNRTVTATGEVALGTRVVDGLGTLEIDVDGTLTRTAGPTGGQVNATLRKNFDQPDTFLYLVGTGVAPNLEFSPVNVVVTALTAATGELSVRANDGIVPATPPLSANSLQRYWTLEGTGITADVTFNYLPSDVVGIEGAYRTVRVTGTTPTIFFNECPAGAFCVSPLANTITARNLSTFSNWSATQVIPTAAEVSVSGRVTYNGRGLGLVRLNLTDTEGNVMTATTNRVGFYVFEKVPTGVAYILTPAHRRLRFTPQVLIVTDNMEGVDFVAELR